MSCPYCGSEYRYKNIIREELINKCIEVYHHCVCRDCHQDYIEFSIYEKTFVETVEIEKRESE